MLKYITSSSTKNKYLDIPNGENLEKILRLINRFVNTKKNKNKKGDL